MPDSAINIKTKEEHEICQYSVHQSAENESTASSRNVVYIKYTTENEKWPT
jgi:hypothetical protein